VTSSATYGSEDGHGLLAEPHGVQDVVVQDGLEQVVLVVSLERRLARHHLIHQHAQRPPVHRRPVLQLLQDLHRERGEGGGVKVWVEVK